MPTQPTQAPGCSAAAQLRPVGRRRASIRVNVKRCPVRFADSVFEHPPDQLQLTC
jgi:hypothetical protein